MSGMEAAVASGLLKVAGHKLVSLIGSEFAAIARVAEDLSELHGIHGEITSWLSTVRDGSIECDPQFRWVIKLKDVAYDIDDLLHEVQLEYEKHKIHSNGDKHAIFDTLREKPKSFMFRRKMARKIKDIKVKYNEIVRQRRDANTIRSSLQVDQPIPSSNMIIGELSLLSNVEESKIPIRDQEMDTIVSMLVDSKRERIVG